MGFGKVVGWALSVLVAVTRLIPVDMIPFPDLLGNDLRR